MNKNILHLGILLIILTSCAPAQGSPQVWFDQPLSGSYFPLAPLQITLHATDTSGISQVQLLVNGDLVETISSQSAQSSLSMLSTVWTPSLPGKYTLQVRALSTSGSWSDPADSIVFIGEIAPLDGIPSDITFEATLPAGSTSTLESRLDATSTSTNRSAFTATLRKTPTKTATIMFRNLPTSTPSPTRAVPTDEPTATPRLVPTDPPLDTLTPTCDPDFEICR